MKKRFCFSLAVRIIVLFCALTITAVPSLAVNGPSVIYCGNDIVDLYIGDCGEGKKCELYRDDDKIAEGDNQAAGGFYCSDCDLSAVTYWYTVKQYLYDENTESWVYSSTSDEVEVDTSYVWGTIHNGDAWCEKLGRLTISWDSLGSPYLCKGITVADGELCINPGTEVIFYAREHGLNDLKGTVDAEEVAFSRESDGLSPEIVITGGELRNCQFQEDVKLKMEGDGGHYSGNVFNGHYLTVNGQNHLFRENTGATEVWINNGSHCIVEANEVNDTIKVGGSSNLIKWNTCATVYIDWGDANEITQNNVLRGGILLDDDDTNTLILENDMTDEQGSGQYGVRLKGSGNIVKDNLIRNRSVGIYSQGTFAHGNTIEGNRIEDCSQYGIQFKFGPYENVIQKNYIARCGYCGIDMLGASANQILNNSFDSNGGSCGDKYWLGDGGIQLVDYYGTYPYNDEAGSIQNVIAFNHIWGSTTGTGIAVLKDFCKGTGIHDNIIEDNNLGIRLEGSAGIVYNNILRRNVSHAQGSPTPEEGVDNRWNHDRAAVNGNIVGGPYLGGNYWDDYTGVDGDGDEIGDTSYAITIYDADGNAIDSVYDDFPLKPGSHYADIAVAPASHDFGIVEVGQSSAVQTFTISNGGTAGLAVSVSITGADAADFAVVDDLCSGAAVAPSESCSLGVLFTPATEGEEKEAILRLSSNDLDESPLEVPLHGGGSYPLAGDLDLDWDVDLADAVIVLQVLVGLNPATVDLKGDVNSDGRLDLADVIFIIQTVAQKRL